MTPDIVTVVPTDFLTHVEVFAVLAVYGVVLYLIHRWMSGLRHDEW